MSEENMSIILQVLIEFKKPVSLEDLMDASSCEKPEVMHSLNVLQRLDLVHKEKNEKTNVISYFLIKEIKGIHLAKAAQIGLDLTNFEGFFKIDKKQKELALGLATKAEKIKHLDVKNRKPLLQKRGYLVGDKIDGNSENLMFLLEATNSSLYEYIEKLAEKDAHLKLLIDLHEQAELSLRDYSGTLK